MADEQARFGRYVPGSWPLLCGARTWLLVDVPDDAPTLDRLWSLLDSSADVSEVLDELAGAGIEHVPSFALVHFEDGAEKAVLRGAATIRLATSAGRAVELSCPPGVTTWLEYPIGSRLSDVHLSAGGRAGGGSWLPINTGVALASAAEVGTRLGWSEAEGSGQDAEPSRQEPPATGELDPPAEATEPTPEVQTPEPSHAQYDFLFEATQRRTIEDAAVREPEEGPLAEASPSLVVGEVDPALTLVGEPEMIGIASTDEEMEAPQAALPQHAASSAGGGLIVSVPGIDSVPGSDEPAVELLEPEGPSPSEVDDRTVSRAQIQALAAGGELLLGPLVKAIPCPADHPNPPHSATCRVCGAQLASTTPVTVPRPVLGVLRLSTGASVPLDRGAIFGRSPDATSGEGGERPHVVRLPSPEKDISRNHLEVRLDGWHVIVTDLRSTNGTLVTVPGEQPQRLRPDEPLPITPGTVVSLADEVSFVYEVEG